MSNINFEMPPQVAVEKQWFTEARSTEIKTGICAGQKQICGGHDDQNEAIKCKEKYINESKKHAAKNEDYRKDMAKHKIEIRIVRFELYVDEGPEEFSP